MFVVNGKYIGYYQHTIIHTIMLLRLYNVKSSSELVLGHSS